MARKIDGVKPNKDIFNGLRETFYANYTAKILFKEKNIDFTKNPYGMVFFWSMIVDSAMYLEDAFLEGKSSIVEAKELMKQNFIMEYESVTPFINEALTGTEILGQYNNSFDAAVGLGEELFIRTRGADIKRSPIILENFSVPNDKALVPVVRSKKI